MQTPHPSVSLSSLYLPGSEHAPIHRAPRSAQRTFSAPKPPILDKEICLSQANQWRLSPNTYWRYTTICAPCKDRPTEYVNLGTQEGHTTHVAESNRG
jgi:hypothetical protein